MKDKLHNEEQNPPIKLNKSFYNFKNDDINLISFKKKLARCQSDFLYHLSHIISDKILSPINLKRDKRLNKPQEIILIIMKIYMILIFRKLLLEVVLKIQIRILINIIVNMKVIIIL